MPAHCDNCGYDFFTTAFGVPARARITVVGCRTVCPRCHHITARVQDGVYELIGRVVQTARAQGVRRENLEAFQTLTRAAQSGEISTAAAMERANEIGSAFGALLKWANENGTALSLLLSVLTLVIALYGALSADEGPAQQHLDAQAQLQAILNLQQLQQRIYEELLTRHSPDELQGERSQTKQETTRQHPEQTPKKGMGATNRHERRKAAKLGKKRPLA
jgi:hypothetical protein